jgi:hypothetical protein
MRDEALYATHRYLGEDDEASAIARRQLRARGASAKIVHSLATQGST